MTKFIELPDTNGENHALNIDTVYCVGPMGNQTRLLVAAVSTLETFDTNLSYKEVVKLFKLHKLMEE